MAVGALVSLGSKSGGRPADAMVALERIQILCSGRVQGDCLSLELLSNNNYHVKVIGLDPAGPNFEGAGARYGEARDI